MSKVFIDTNVLIYAQNRSSPYYPKAMAILESLSVHQPGIITPFIINEFHYVLLKLKGPLVAQKHTVQILDIPHLQLSNPSFSVKDITSLCRLATKYQLKTFDAFHAYSCNKMKIKYIATFDSDFKRLPWLKLFKTPITTPLSN